MKAIQIAKPNELKLIDVEKPVITEKDNVLVKMTAAGICGSDVGVYHGTNTAATCPRITGHEMASRVEEAGPGITSLKVGDRVTINQVTSRGYCYLCKIGRGNVYDNLAVRGMHTDDGYREYIAVPESDCYIFPESLSDQGIVMIGPTAIGIQSCTRVDLEKDDLLPIYSSNALSSSILKTARLPYDHVIIANVMDNKLEAAKANGVTHVVNVLEEDLIEKVKEYTYGHGATIFIDAVHNKGSPINLLQVTGNAGRVMTMGFSTAPTEISQFLVASKELGVKGSRLQNKVSGEAIELVNEDKLNLTNSISHTLPLTKTQEAFDSVNSHNPPIHRITLTLNS